MNKPTTEFLTQVQVAELLQIPERTLEQWRLQRRVLPFQKIGKLVRYSRQSVDAYLRQHQVSVDVK